MTSIKLTVTGAQAWASVTGPLTSGMIGIPVTIEYDAAWDGLTKNLMCRCSPWGSDNGEIRAILNVGENAAVAHEVMQPDMYLHLGVEGFSDDGKLVIPTTWARCGKIEFGANTCEDPSSDPELPVWNQLQTEMEQLKEYTLSQDQVDMVQACAQEAAQAAQEARQAADEAKQAANAGGSGLYYTPVVTQPTSDTLRFEFKPSATGAPIPSPVTVELPVCEDSGQNVELDTTLTKSEAAADAKAVGDAIANFRISDEDRSNIVAEVLAGLGLDVVGSIREDGSVALTGNLPNGVYIMRYINRDGSVTEIGTMVVTDGADPGGDPTEPIRVLERIEAVYTGGNVPAGTDITTLSGLVVTGYYSDGSTAAITNYTMAGQIVPGENTITVRYAGLTAEFVVIGVATGDSGTVDQIALSIDETGAIYNGIGYMPASRIKSDGSIVAVDKPSAPLPIFATGYIPAPAGSVIRMEGCWIDTVGLGTDSETRYYYGDSLSSASIITANEEFTMWQRVTLAVFESATFVGEFVKDAETGYITGFTVTGGEHTYIRFNLCGDPTQAKLYVTAGDA